MQQVLAITHPSGTGLTTGQPRTLQTAGSPQYVILTAEQGAGSNATTTIGLSDLVAYVRKRWKLGALIALPLAALTFWSLGMGKKVYEAESRILLLMRDPDVFHLDTVTHATVTELSAPMLVNNHRSELKSRRYMDYLYDHVGEADRAAFINEGSAGPSWTTKITSLFSKPAPTTPVAPQDIFARKLDLATHVEPLKDSHILRVQIRTGDAGLAARLANHYIEDYIHYVADESTRITATESDYLEKKAAELRAQLEESEKQLQAYREAKGLVQDSETKDVDAEKIRLLTLSLSDADVKLTKAKQDLSNVQQAQASGRDLLDLKLVADNPDVANTRKLLEQKMADRAPLETWAGPHHPKLIAINNEIESYRTALKRNVDAVVTMVETEVIALSKQIEEMGNQLKASQTAVLVQGGKNIDQNMLRDKVAQNRALYQQIVQRLNQAEVTGQFKDSGLLRVSDSAVPPEKPVKPNKPIALVAAMFVFGLLFLGVPVGYGFYDEQIAPNLTAKREPVTPAASASPEMAPPALTQGTAPPQAPLLHDGSVVATLGEVADPTPANILTEFVRPGSGSADSLRELVNGLESRAKLREGPGVILVASAEPGEGKTSLSSALAAGFCNQGRRVFMVEANSESPTFHLLFPHAYTHATWTNDGLETLRYGTSNLYLLPSHEGVSTTGSDILESYRGWIEKARPQVDWIILDGSSVMRNFSDVAPLLPLATEVLLVQDQSRGSLSKATAAMHLLRPRLPEQTFLGLVSNRSR